MIKRQFQKQRHLTKNPNLILLDNMKEYIVTKPVLNIRSSASDASDDNFIGQLFEGESLFLKDETVLGTIPKDGTSNIWRLDHLNRLVASEGVRPRDFGDRLTAFVKDQNFEPLHRSSTDINNWHINWGFADLELWKIWRDHNTRGEGVRVAVIDLGVNDDQNDLRGRISQRFSFIGNDPADVRDESNGRHGTKSAGLIGASGASTVYGIAPECELIVIKAGDSAFETPNILKAVKKAIELGAQIISMSIGSPDQIEGLEEIFLSQKDNPTLFFAATGNRGNEDIFYPGGYDGCFSVGAYSIQNNSRIIYQHNNKNDAIKFLSPGMDILTCSDTTAPAKYHQSSAATAFASGMMALVCGALGRIPTYTEMIDALKNGHCTNRIKSPDNFSITEGYGVLLPNELINHLKQ
jgi:major intracellular serine protease